MPKNNIFYAGYNTLDKTIIYETMFRHRSDTVDQMEFQYGANWQEDRPYLTITECEVVVNEQSTDKGNRD